MRHVDRFAPVLLSAALLLEGCGGLRLDKYLRAGPDDWPTFAGSTSRTNVSPDTVSPPLTLEWDTDVSAGVGNGSLLVSDSLLVLGTLRGELCVLNLYTGKKIGCIGLGEAIQGSPVIDGPVVYVAEANSRGSLVAFDVMTGKARWSIPCGDVEVSPLLMHDRLFVGNTEGEFLCVSGITGARIWSYAIPDNTSRFGIRSSAAGRDSTIVFGADNGSVYALNAETGKERWTFHADGGIVAAPALAGDTIVVGSLGGTVYGLDFASGARMWQYHTGSPIYASATVTPDAAIVPNVRGSVVALRPGNGILLWRTETGSPIDAGILASGPMLYTGTLAKQLVAIRAADGAVVWKTDVDGRIKTSPTAADGRIFVATDEQEVYCYRGRSE